MAEQPAAAAAGQGLQHNSNGAASGKGSIATAPTFQEAVKRLQDYWSAQGCIVWLPHNTEVGAGTMNPATFLRCVCVGLWVDGWMGVEREMRVVECL